jgi:hypothetical protein
MAKITPADDLLFLSLDLHTAKTLARRALEAANPRLLKSGLLEEPVDVRFYKGSELRSVVKVIVQVANLQIAELVLDRLTNDLVSFECRCDAASRYVVGILDGEQHLRIHLNERGKLQLEVQEGGVVRS